MEIIYVHHAEREINFNANQDDGLTVNGVAECELYAQKIKNEKRIAAIYSSPYNRCKKTSELINKYINKPIYYDERFNEFKNGAESVSAFLSRNIEALKEIKSKYSENDIILVVTSGVNIMAFICMQYNIKPSDDITFVQAKAISPVGFNL